MRFLASLACMVAWLLAGGHAQAPSPAVADAQVQLGDRLLAEGRYTEAAALRERYPLAPDVAAVHGDALWAYGLFDDAEAAEARSALQVNSRDAEFHYTAGAIAARMHRFEDASLAFRNYVNLLPNRDTNPEGGLGPGGDSVSGFVQRAAYYVRRELVMSRRLESVRYDAELPLRMHRLATVLGRVNGTHRATFIVDTGGEAISISQTTAGVIGSRLIWSGASWR